MSSEAPNPGYKQHEKHQMDHHTFHRAPTLRPATCTEQLLPAWHFWSWFERYLAAIFGIAVLGGQITFTLIVSDIADPATLFNDREPAFSKEEVRFLIAISWLFFTCTLAVAVMVALLFDGGSSTSSRDSWAYRIRNFQRLFGIVVTFFLNFFLIGAFLMLCLATSAYVPIVGWLGTGFVGLFGLVVFCFWGVGWRTCQTH